MDATEHLRNLFVIHKVQNDQNVSLLSKIVNNIIKEPNNTKYHKLITTTITDKLNCSKCLNILFYAGFKKTNDGTQLIWDNNTVNLNKIQLIQNTLKINNVNNNLDDNKVTDNIDWDPEEYEQECFVTGKDSRDKIYDHPHKDKDIIKCIGQLKITFKYPKYPSQAFKENLYGTGTVYHCNNQKGFIITCAHNIRQRIFICTDCNQYNHFKKQNIISKVCIHCKSNNIVCAEMLEATQIQFRRKCIKTKQIDQNTNDEYKFGDTIKSYICTEAPIFNYHHAMYQKYPSTVSGYDLTVLLFNDDANYYSKYVQNISIKCAENVLDKSNKNIQFNIFGYPQMKHGTENNKMYGMQSSKSQNYEFKLNSETNCYYFEQMDIDTSGGQSGSALWVYDKMNNKTIIYGVHTGGNYKRKVNVATPINALDLKTIPYNAANDNDADIKSVKISSAHLKLKSLKISYDKIKNQLAPLMSSWFGMGSGTLSISKHKSTTSFKIPFTNSHTAFAAIKEQISLRLRKANPHITSAIQKSMNKMVYDKVEIAFMLNNRINLMEEQFYCKILSYVGKSIIVGMIVFGFSPDIDPNKVKLIVVIHKEEWKSSVNGVASLMIKLRSMDASDIGNYITYQILNDQCMN